MTIRYPRRVLGIDPGTGTMGWCLIEFKNAQTFSALEFGTITPRESDPLHRRLARVLVELGPIVDRAADLCAEVVVERPFVNKNYMATLAIAAARGIALALVGKRGLRFAEVSPQSWKLITGRGNATPEQYSYVVQQLLRQPERMPWDAAAAGGLAIYHGTKEESED